MFANLFSQLDAALKQLNRRGSYTSVTTVGNSRISLFSSNGSTPPVVSVSADGSTIIVTSGN